MRYHWIFRFEIGHQYRLGMGTYFFCILHFRPLYFLLDWKIGHRWRLGSWVRGRLVGDLEALGESGGGTTTVGRRLVPSAPWQKPNLFLFWGGANSHFWDGTIQFLQISFYYCQSLKTLSFTFWPDDYLPTQIFFLYFLFCERLCYLLIYAALQTKPTNSKMAGMMLKMMNPMGSMPVSDKHLKKWWISKTCHW